MLQNRFQPEDDPELIHPDHWQGPPSALVERLWNVPVNHPTDQSALSAILRLLLHRATVRILMHGGDLTRLVHSEANTPPGRDTRPLPGPTTHPLTLLFGIILVPSNKNTLTSLLPVMDDHNDLTGRQARIDLQA